MSETDCHKSRQIIGVKQINLSPLRFFSAFEAFETFSIGVDEMNRDIWIDVFFVKLLLNLCLNALVELIS